MDSARVHKGRDIRLLSLGEAITFHGWLTGISIRMIVGAAIIHLDSSLWLLLCCNVA